MKVKDIKWDAKGILLERPNRFVGIVRILMPKNLGVHKVHIHDPGRLKEILFPGNKVYLKRENIPGRKTKWDLIAGEVNGKLVFTNSRYHREISVWTINHLKIFGEVDKITPEFTYKRSRMDFLLIKKDREILVETKGCTLAKDGIALFPDAPTTRGKRHVEELIEARKEGKEAALLILVFREDARCFSPNFETDPEFARTFLEALKSDVKVYPLVFSYSGESISYLTKIPICPHSG
ncbi:MAG: DNA/RNA nuclease SfsA [Candidatus Aminicenantes bacterium]|nr:DNA/RNA nuclease SfsA [Candidatus Aminicenantes bacterium]